MAAACPICKKALSGEREAQLGPFCSQRCKLIDLGNWLGGKYAVAGDERTSAPGVHDEDEPS
jgi:endogenous inhibitor of DNA gyrase (YacG/DUF329 family)